MGLIIEEVIFEGLYEMIEQFFYKFVDDNTNTDGDDYEFASMGQGNRLGPNRARRNVSFGHGGVFGQKENSRDIKHHDNLGEELSA